MQKLKLKRIAIAIIAVVLSTSSIFAASFGKPAAIIKFNGQTVAVSMDELDSQYAQVADLAKKQGLDEMSAKKQVLDTIINNKLFVSAATRDGVTADAATIDQLYLQQKASYEQNIGRSMTIEEFDGVVTKSIGSISTYKDLLKTQYIIEKYIEKVKGDEIKASGINPTETEITTFFRTNKTKFINPETVNIAQIFIPFKDNDTNPVTVKTMNNVLTQLKTSSIGWNDAVAKYSQAGSNKKVDGDIGWLTLDDQGNVKGALGTDFFNTAFETPVGGYSKVIKSTTGYHILKVKRHEDAKMLTITDPISPADTVNVHDYIGKMLAQNKIQAAYTKAVEELAKTLLSQATVTKLI
ncbi:MAG: peptidylprolyl isomerase [Spirochaetaceae bacterium]|nr:peptidylprolyl isomerase [Spirochaetaceae bacterium]